MRLWPLELLPKLPWNQLAGQHRECCALRGLGWGKKHATVDYVFNYSPCKLFAYHEEVIDEMLIKKPNIKLDLNWCLVRYRGKSCEPWKPKEIRPDFNPRYPEHNAAYLAECIANLKAKGIEISA